MADDDLPMGPSDAPGPTPPSSGDGGAPPDTDVPVVPPAPGDGGPEMQIEEDLRDSYLSYAMSVIISRALPDVRDGLKPSQRRILVAMNDLGLSSRGKEAKCARICGETSGKYHPHGESVLYPTLVRLAQPFNIRYPLVAGQGNFGTIDGLPPAAMRYTEAKMSRVAEEMLADLERDTVDTIPNYDETLREPIVLPGKFPNLLCNGSTGIAVGMATNIPPHNLTEVCNAAILMIDNPQATLAELLEQLPGPDFPTGGIICGRRGIVEAYRTGRGRIVIRAKTHFEEERGRHRIVVTEIPYMQQKIRLIQRIAQAVKDDRVEGISNVQDHSNRQGIRIVIDLKRDADPDVVLNQLFHHTPLQDGFSIIMLALVSNRPRTLPLDELLREFLEHRLLVLRRRTQFLLRKARNRAHVVEGLLIALSSIDEVIARIRASADIPEARASLMGLEVSAELLNRALGDEGFTSFQAIMGVQASYNLTRIQADHILQMQLQRLTALERDKLLKEYEELRDEITEYERLLSDDANIYALIREDLVEIRDKYGDARRTEIQEAGVDDFDIEDLIREETCVVMISHKGYIKRQALSEYRTQGRGGRGITGGQSRDGDFLSDVFIASTHDYILFFTDRGQCHWLKVYDLPNLGRTAQGRAIVNLLQLRPAEGDRPEERVTSYRAVRNFDDRSLLMVTRQGLIKKTRLSAYSRPKKGGIIGVGLNEGDQLISVLLTKPGDEVILSTKHGMAIRFPESGARDMGRSARGVKGIDLREDDEVVGAVVVDPAAGRSLLTVCERGFGKRTSFDEYRTQSRGGKGLIDIKTTDRNGNVVAVATVNEDDDVMMLSKDGMVVRISAESISMVGRNTQGVTLMRVGDDDRVAGLATIAREDEIPEGDETASAGPIEAPVATAEGDETEGDADAADDDLTADDEPEDGQEPEDAEE